MAVQFRLDVVDVAVPVVSGLGEIADTINVARKAGDIVDAVRTVDKIDDTA